MTPELLGTIGEAGVVVCLLWFMMRREDAASAERKEVAARWREELRHLYEQSGRAVASVTESTTALTAAVIEAERRLSRQHHQLQLQTRQLIALVASGMSDMTRAEASKLVAEILGDES